MIPELGNEIRPVVKRTAVISHVDCNAEMGRGISSELSGVPHSKERLASGSDDRVNPSSSLVDIL